MTSSEETKKLQAAGWTGGPTSWFHPLFTPDGLPPPTFTASQALAIERFVERRIEGEPIVRLAKLQAKARREG